MDWLFDPPWWLPTVAIGGGAAILFVGLRNGDRGPTRVGGAIFALGVLIASISYVVETDLEKAVDRTYRLAQAVEDRDWETFGSLLDPQTSLYGFGTREALVALAKRTTENLDIRSVWVLSPEAERRGPIILVTVRVMVEAKNFLSDAIATDWQFQWQDFGQGWVLYNIRALSSEQTSEQIIRERLEQM